jgi:hypothetical protein
MAGIKESLKKYKIIKKIIIIRDRIRVKNACDKSRKYIKIEKMGKMHNAAIGKRCFVIGNGPSLTLDDINMLKNEDCFACNSIYKLFSKTEWRPKYYVSQDIKVLDDLRDDFDYITRECENVFLNTYVCEKYPGVCDEENVYPIFVDTFDDDIHFPQFSDDIAKCVSEGYTVTYSCIQMAVYMGYSEIYILGCDHNYSATFRLDGSIKKDSEVNQNYMTLIDHKLINLPRLDKTTLAYQRARIECEKRGVKIFNSTRGGKLEVFERKEFDSLF